MPVAEGTIYPRQELPRPLILQFGNWLVIEVEYDSGGHSAANSYTLVAQYF
jgi:hypothetical protein